MKFGDMLRAMRVEREMTLRELALRTDIDVAYLSRVERCTIAPPQKDELLDSILNALGLKKEEAQKLRDQAAVDNEQFPKDIAKNIKKVEGFPMFMRTVLNKKLNGEQLQKLTDFINERY